LLVFFNKEKQDFSVFRQILEKSKEMEMEFESLKLPAVAFEGLRRLRDDP
jgi:hypothetical protein